VLEQSASLTPFESIEERKHAISRSQFAVGGSCRERCVAVSSVAQNGRSDRSGAVFVMNNSVSRNEIISFRRAPDGSLQPDGVFATGGRGTGGVTDPLESQGSLTLSQDHSLLFAVNGGSGEVSVFQVRGPSLFLVDKELSGGSEPNAVVQHGGLVYVLNVGGSSNVVGFKLNAIGQLRQISNSTRFLTSNNS
jgi:6-phosphogluconolactonase